MKMEISHPHPVEIIAPPSKSLSHRYLIGAALANGESEIQHTLESEDLVATRQILCAAGAKMSPIQENGEVTGWRVIGMAGKPKGGVADPLQCNVHESGTTCRLLTGVLAAGTGLFHIFGEGRMHNRPMKDLCKALQNLGSHFDWQGEAYYPPYILRADRLHPDKVDGYLNLSMDESSQYFSGLLMASPMAASPLTIELAGKKAVSWPYIALTLQCLARFGIKFSVQKRPRIGAPWVDLAETSWKLIEEMRPGCFRVRIMPGFYRSGIYRVEGDWSGASYFLAAGAIGKRPVSVLGLSPQSMQGDRVLLDILAQMGAKIEIGKDRVTVYPSSLHGVSLDMGSCPDLVPTVAVLAAYAKGSTRIGNVAHLRLKESDRIMAPATELAKTGVMIDPLSDGLLINGMGGLSAGNLRNRPHRPTLPDGVTLSAHNDHRMAMSLALLELQDDGLNMADRLDKPGVVAKSFPEFWKFWSRLRQEV